MSKGRQLWYDIRYEKLPNYCFWCGGFDHVEKDCVATFEEGAEEDDERHFANLKMLVSRQSFTKVANAQRWAGDHGQEGPRFVHRWTSGNGAFNLDNNNVVTVVDDDEGLQSPASSGQQGFFGEDNGGSDLKPGLAQTLNGLRIIVADNLVAKESAGNVPRSSLVQASKVTRGIAEELVQELDGVSVGMRVMNSAWNQANPNSSGGIIVQNNSAVSDGEEINVGLAQDGGDGSTVGRYAMVSKLMEPMQTVVRGGEGSKVGSNEMTPKSMEQLNIIVGGGDGNKVGNGEVVPKFLEQLQTVEGMEDLRMEPSDVQLGGDGHTEELP